MIFKCGTNGVVDRIVVGDVGQGYAAYLRAKTWTNLDDLHRQILRLLYRRCERCRPRHVLKLYSPAKSPCGQETPQAMLGVRRPWYFGVAKVPKQAGHQA